MKPVSMLAACLVATVPLATAGSLVPIAVAAAEPAGSRALFPPVPGAPRVDIYFGAAIADPYHGLEEIASPAVQAWIEAQNARTRARLGPSSTRAAIRARLAALWRYTSYYAPVRRGPWYFHYRSLEGGPFALWKTPRLDDDGAVLIDPATLALDGATAGTLSLTNISPSEDGHWFAYVASDGSTTWNTWRVREVTSGRDLPEVLHWGLAGTAAWALDGSGFYYGRIDPPRDGSPPPTATANQGIAFHRLRTEQAADRTIYARPDHPDWTFEALMTEAGRWLVLVQHQPDAAGNRLLLLDLRRGSRAAETLVDDPAAHSTVVAAVGDTFYVLTDLGAPHYRVVAIDHRQPAPTRWRTIVAEDPGATIVATVMHSGELVVQRRRDAHDELALIGLDGKAAGAIALPELGTVFSIDPFLGRSNDREMFFDFTSFDRPLTNYRYDFAKRSLAVWRRPGVDLAASALAVEERFAISGDGTRIPVFLMHRQGLPLDGTAPTYLTAYGAFGVELTPTFNPANAAWASMGGVYALALVRGGGEFGASWTAGGKLTRKQNGVDDFLSAAELLIHDGVTVPSRLAIGGSGPATVLVGAAMAQRPELFAAAVVNRGPLDMLRYESLGSGAQWVGEYGSPSTPEGFAALRRLSPLGNLTSGRRYPRLLAVTGIDDTASPVHALKLVAALQALAGEPEPALLRFETEGGFTVPPVAAADRPLEERADTWLFLADVLGLRIPTASP